MIDCVLCHSVTSPLMQATRVMWTPPLRESFAMPFILLQQLILCHTIRWGRARAERVREWLMTDFAGRRHSSGNCGLA